MKIAFRTDASTRIGTGHVMRCAVLAKHLQNLGATILFFCRSMPGDLCSFLEEQNLPVHRMPSISPLHPNISEERYHPWLGISPSQEMLESEIALRNNGPFDWLVVDHYALDSKWQQAMVYFAKKIFVMDDMACKQHCCDILLNHAYLPGLREKYSSLVSSDVKLLLGPDYFILNPEFHKKKHMATERDGHIRRIFIFYGGVDATNETRKVVDAITNMQRHDFHVDVVVTNRNPYRNEISDKISALPNFSLYIQLPNLAELMCKSSISFGAGGGTTYERMFLGLPSIVTTTATHQVAVMRHMHDESIVCWLGNADEVESTDLLNALTQAIDHPEKLCEQSSAALRIVDGEGLSRIDHILAS